MGACKKGGVYQTKDGQCYCERCMIKYVNRYEISDFWPHYREAIEDCINRDKKRQEIERYRREICEKWAENDLYKY